MRKCQKLQFLEWPLEADTWSKPISIDSHVKMNFTNKKKKNFNESKPNPVTTIQAKKSRRSRCEEHENIRHYHKETTSWQTDWLNNIVRNKTTYIHKTDWTQVKSTRKWHKRKQKKTKLKQTQEHRQRSVGKNNEKQKYKKNYKYGGT